MVEITYYRSCNRVTITGHALSNEPGKDLVCSAVSSLAYTLAANVQQLEESGYVRNIHVRMDPGDYEVSCTPTTRMRSVVMLIYQAICLGFASLAVHYPDNVRYDAHD